MRTAAPVVRFLRGPGGARVAYAMHGRGAPLICPAWWLSHLESDWELPEFRAFFEHLGEVATVIRYDRPGVGLSAPTEIEPSLAVEVELLSLVVEAVAAERVSLLGVSCGGPPAIAWAAQHPARVERLVLCGSYARGNALAPEPLQEALAGLVRAHWGAGARALADVFIPDATARQRDAFTKLQREATDAASAERFLRLTYAMDASDSLARVEAPTLVLHRRDCRAIPFAAGREAAAEIPGAVFVPLDGRMHPPWMAGDAVAPIADFLRGRPAVAPSKTDCYIDEASRALLRDGERVPLTPLELGLLRHLVHATGNVVSRDQLLERVWGQKASGSNVVDAVVRTLRKKLRDWAPSLETVVGHGYRFRGWQRR